jgi:hypothetical protein
MKTKLIVQSMVARAAYVLQRVASSTAIASAYVHERASSHAMVAAIRELPFISSNSIWEMDIVSQV